MQTILLTSKLIDVGNEVANTILNVIVVFLVLLLIIVGVYYISKLMDRSTVKENKHETNITNNHISKAERNTNIKDDDMMAAVLVATIDFRNEIKEDVRLVNVKEIN